MIVNGDETGKVHVYDSKRGQLVSYYDKILYTGTRRVSARQILEDLFVLSDIELRANEEPEFIEQI